MWEMILKERTLVLNTILKSYEELGYEYISKRSNRATTINHHLVYYLDTDELGNLIMNILEENERRNTLDRFDIEGFRFAMVMRNPDFRSLVNFFSHIVYQLTFDEVKKLVENNDGLLLAKIDTIEARRNSDVITIYRFVDGSPEIYRNVVRLSEQLQKDIDAGRY